jgi:DNA (cytosine-5)-methyltransferase 1
MNELALFAGAGGGILGGKLLGWRTVCAVEWEPYAASVLAQRQNDGLLSPFPIWDDVRTFDGRPWRGLVDVVSGGFPCQDISVAGKGAGITGERSGMWTHMARIVGEVRPRFVFVENSPALLTRGLGVVLGDLAALGYDCRWTVLGAADVGAPHQRDRFWLAGSDADRQRCGEARQLRSGAVLGSGGLCEALANADQHARDQRRPGDADQSARGRDADRSPVGQNIRHADSSGLEVWQGIASNDGAQLAALERAGWWVTEPDVGRVANGVAARVDRLRAIGNGQVPACHATAWRVLTEAA